jgi:hypothetical protein
MPPELKKQRRTFEKETAAQSGHEIHFIGSFMTDRYKCQCMWKSDPYQDGEEYAYADWRTHVISQIGPFNYPLELRVETDSQ